MSVIFKLPHSHSCLTEFNGKVEIVVSSVLTMTLAKFEVILLAHRHCSEDIISEGSQWLP